MATKKYPDKTLLFLRDPLEQRLLLAVKKRGFGAGKWNGIGGKVERGETIEEAAIREANEEVGVTVALANLTKLAELTFVYREKQEWDCHVHVFVTCRWTGEPTESDEMRPAWYPEDTLPFDQMWEDDRYWLPEVLAGTYVQASFTFGADGSLFDIEGIAELPR